MPAAVLIALGAGFAVLSWGYGYFQDRHIGPGFLPGIVGLLLVVFGVMIVLETWRSRAGSADAESHASGTPSAADEPFVESVGAEPADEGGIGRVVAIAALLLAAVWLTGWLGFLVSFTLVAFAILFGVEREPLWRSLAISIGIGVLAWLVFEWGMGIRLPPGLLSFLDS